MAIWLKQSTAVTLIMGPFVDSTDGVTPETALSLTQAETRLSKNGGAFAQKNDANTATHGEEGNYLAALNTTDTGTLGILRVSIYVSGALPVWMDCMVVPANIYDSVVGGTDILDVSVTQLLGGTLATPAVTGVIKADVTHFAGTATTASSGRPEVNTTHVGGTSQTAGDIMADTNDIQTRLPAALVSGRIDASVGAMAANTVTASAIATAAIDADSIATDAITAAKIAADAIGASELATDAVTEIVAAVWAKVCETNGSYTAQQILSVALAVLSGVTSSNGAVLKDPAGTNTRVSATIDSNNNRTAMTVTPSS